MKERTKEILVNIFLFTAIIGVAIGGLFFLFSYLFYEEEVICDVLFALEQKIDDGKFVYYVLLKEEISNHPYQLIDSNNWALIHNFSKIKIRIRPNPAKMYWQFVEGIESKE